MEFLFSKHALEQIHYRRLSLESVENVLYSPDVVIPDIEGVVVYQKLVVENNKSYLYRVFVNKLKTPPLIITAYKTSKTEKYENQV
ncbi:MAG: DUF4258 domain-containing protein [Bacteroidales bacterium]|nr:DUF4258 domain-containing protein [Bacteroidales bacterium]